ncbi:MAG: tonB-system energizer ExbB [Candidatus Devosia phytovorans]|uniref:Biopolymer transport protein ExbB n=1 Tax=Candidatus Devosia phytovorans TaxID=3121372 RepID=A0AAJ5VT38_9HYPH|nr:tonB-system energizer ExbB [Devosia sp.]WEK03661.1 MAG: tonB-system energizer ExbB [Devosia sp.]
MKTASFLIPLLATFALALPVTAQQTDAPAPSAPIAEPDVAAPPAEPETPETTGVPTPQPTANETPAPAIVPAPTETIVPAPAPAVAPPTAETDPAAEAAAAEAVADHSPWGMFMAADIVVKTVMAGLALASVITWTIWLAKSLEIWGAKTRLKRALRVLQQSTSLEAAAEALRRRKGAGIRLLQAAQQEVARAEKVIDYADNSGLKDRVASRLGRIELAVSRKLNRGTGVLASIGSVSPFVGLFGTVWGIMNSFVSIAAAKTSSLAVVAPGIAEALLATAIGLVAAIPAVIIYNAFARSISGYKNLLGDASAAIERLVSSDLDHRYVARKHPHAFQAAE